MPKLVSCVSQALWTFFLILTQPLEVQLAVLQMQNEAQS